MRGQAVCGLACFLGVTAALSANLRAVNWRTIGWGFALQLLLALFVIQFRPGYLVFEVLTDGVKQLLAFTDAGGASCSARWPTPRPWAIAFPAGGFVFAFSALPTIIFIASFFSVLYYFGVLQFVVRVMRAS